MDDAPFWRRKTLAEMTSAEWESLCDGCGLCCVIRLEDDETGDVTPTRVSCRLLDAHTCRCTDYADRHRTVPDCIKLTPGNIRDLPWMPRSCAYRRLYEGKDLPSWHPLVTGDPESVHRAGVSVRGQTINEACLDDPDDAMDFLAPDWLVDRSDG
ncbi:MAG: YcgN family cysteine cluster protein [Caulobacteraceae bacterium]|nr:YcgN family cysteine cluster protein [Caulobacteraceae bacterium]